MSQGLGAVHSPGKSYPLGATVVPGGVNFSIYSKSSTALELLLFDRASAAGPSRVVSFDPVRTRTFHYGHVFVPDCLQLAVARSSVDGLIGGYALLNRFNCSRVSLLSCSR